MIKLTYSDAFDNVPDVGMTIVTDVDAMIKRASNGGTIFGCSYDDLRPGKGKVGIHLTALGAYERYGANRNYDGFEKSACVNYHDTFVKFGHVFKLHVNKDPKIASGVIKASAYNDDMDRIELFIEADEDKCAEHLTRLEKTGEVPYSMACFLADTPVRTNAGIKAIQDITVNDVVWTHASNWQTVTAVSERKVNDYVYVNTSCWGRTSIGVTANHPFYVASFNQMDRGNRKDHAQYPDKGFKQRHRSDLHKYLHWVDAGDVTEYDYMAVPLETRSDGIDDVNFARLLGYYIAEGSLIEGVLNKLDDAVKELPKLAAWTSVAIKPKSNSEAAVSVQCFGTALYDRIQDLCRNPGINKRVPDAIMRGSAEARFNFASTWFNGDGWQDKNGIHWSTHYQGLAIELQCLLASLGLRASCARIDHKYDRGLVKSEDAVEYVVNISNYYSELFADISKAEVMGVDGEPKTSVFISGNYLMVPITSVVAVHNDTDVSVYNFSVEADESYTVYGLAVHNCKVPGDWCSICNNFRVNSKDPNECDHIKYALGQMRSDGKVATMLNRHPRWFDISFVRRPADRIAWSLKVASAGDPNIAIKQAEDAGIWVPDDVAIESKIGLEKLAILRSVVAMQDQQLLWEANPAGVKTAESLYFYTMRKAAAPGFKADELDKLRELNTNTVFSGMAKLGAVMGVESFFKYIMGSEYIKVAEHIPAVKAMVPRILDEAVKSSSCHAICNDGTFDVDCDRPTTGLPQQSYAAVIDHSLLPKYAEHRAVMSALNEKVIKLAVDKRPNLLFNTHETTVLATKYAAYQISALHAVFNMNRDTNKDAVAAQVAVQNLLSQ